MLPAPLKIGFIGGSINSAVGYTHYIASQMDHRWSLEAGCFSRDPSNNQQTAKAWGVEPTRVYSSWLEMLEAESGKLDAVSILTPTNLHVEMVVKALEMGFNVICEKAMASSVGEARQIINAQMSTSRFLAVTYNYTGYPMVRELAKMVGDGEFGKIHQIHVEMPQEGFARLAADGSKPKPQSWRLLDGVIPTISLDLGVHVHNLIYLLSGQRPIKVLADQSSNGWFPDVIDNVLCMAKYDGGITSQIWFSKSALGHRNGLKIRLFGSKGSAEWYQINPEELKCFGLHGEIMVKDRANDVSLASEIRYNRFKAGHPSGFLEAFANLYVDLADALTNYKAGVDTENHWVFGPEVALEGLLMLDAMKKSALEEAWCNVESL